MKTLKEMLAEARAVVPEQGPAEVKKRIDAAEPLVLIDVRDPDEYRDGFIEPATNISRGFLEFRIGGAAAEPTTPIVCRWPVSSSVCSTIGSAEALRSETAWAG